MRFAGKLLVKTKNVVWGFIGNCVYIESVEMKKDPYREGNICNVHVRVGLPF